MRIPAILRSYAQTIAESILEKPVPSDTAAKIAEAYRTGWRDGVSDVQTANNRAPYFAEEDMEGIAAAAAKRINSR